MKQRNWFLVCALVAVLSLFYACLCVLTPLVVRGYLERDLGIGCFNLLVDIVIGTFTIWGLYWAAREFGEFAVRPAVHLLPGKKSEPELLEGFGRPIMVPGPPFIVPGWFLKPSMSGTPKRLPHLVCCLYLKNTKPKAARFVHLVLRILATPAPSHCHFRHIDAMPENSPLSIQADRDAHNGGYVISVRFADHVVVYQEAVYVGNLVVQWDSLLNDQEVPKRVGIDYDVYTLEGNTRSRIDLHVDWEASAL